MEIYLAALIGAAARTQIGKSWQLDRSQVMVHLAIGDDAFEQVRGELERRLPGKWDRTISADGNTYTYMRLG